MNLLGMRNQRPFLNIVVGPIVNVGRRLDLYHLIYIDIDHIHYLLHIEIILNNIYIIYIYIYISCYSSEFQFIVSYLVILMLFGVYPGVLGFPRVIGVLGFWGFDFGVLGFWGFGVLGFWGFGAGL